MHPENTIIVVIFYGVLRTVKNNVGFFLTTIEMKGNEWKKTYCKHRKLIFNN
jgi:hypothetical protein